MIVSSIASIKEFILDEKEGSNHFDVVFFSPVASLNFLVNYNFIKSFAF